MIPPSCCDREYCNFAFKAQASVGRGLELHSGGLGLGPQASGFDGRPTSSLLPGPESSSRAPKLAQPSCRPRAVWRGPLFDDAWVGPNSPEDRS